MSFQLVWADVPFENVTFGIFNSHRTVSDISTSKSLRMVEKFFTRVAIRGALNVNGKIANMVPFLEQLTTLSKANSDLLMPSSEFMLNFNESIDDANRDATQVKFVLMGLTMQNIRNKFARLDKENQPNAAIRQSNTIFIHSNLESLVNYFSRNKSIFIDYPLESAALLINLALIVAVFTPLASTLLPSRTKHNQLACKFNELLVDYRTRAVILRAHKLNAIDMNYKYVASVLGKPYDPMGYGSSDSGILHCDSGCKDSNYIEITCLIDKFNKKKYHFASLDTIVYNEINHDCILEYVALLRYRTEKMFPVAILDKFCVTPRTPNGKI